MPSSVNRWSWDVAFAPISWNFGKTWKLLEPVIVGLLCSGCIKIGRSLCFHPYSVSVPPKDVIIPATSLKYLYSTVTLNDGWESIALYDLDAILK